MEKPSVYSEALDEYVRAHGDKLAESLAKMGQGFLGRLVQLERTFKDGSVKYEVMPEGLAEMVLAMIPFDPDAANIAKAKILYSEAPALTEELREALIRVAKERVKKFTEFIEALERGEQPEAVPVGKSSVIH